MKKTIWTQEEEIALAKDWLVRRMNQPFENALILFSETIKNTLPEHRRRLINTWRVAAGVRKRIAESWREMQELAAPPAPPEPVLQIVEVEVPVHKTLPETLSSLSTHDLRAELFRRDEERQTQLQTRWEALVAALAAPKNGEHTRLPHMPAGGGGGTARSATRRKPRIALIVPTSQQFQEVQQQAEHYELPVDLRFIDMTKREQLRGQYDFVVMARGASHKWWDQAKQNQQLDGSRIKFVDGGIQVYLQTLRDIASMQPRL